MRLTSYTDYAIRLLKFLAVEPNQAHTVAEISSAYAISRNHLTKVAHALGRAGLIDTVRGRKGGLRLGREPHLIKLGEVVGTTEAAMSLVECFGAGGHASLRPPVNFAMPLPMPGKAFSIPSTAIPWPISLQTRARSPACWACPTVDKLARPHWRRAPIPHKAWPGCRPGQVIKPPLGACSG